MRVDARLGACATRRRLRRAVAPVLEQTLTMQDPAEVARALGEIAVLIGLEAEPRFKVKAYERAARIVETLGEELGLVVEQDRLRGIAGIGAVLSAQIRELWNSGSSQLLLDLRARHPPGAAELVRVQGMTVRRMRAIHEALGVSSVEDLRAACAAGRVRALAGFGVKTEERLLAACDRWLGRSERNPTSVLLAHALELATLIERELSAVVESATVTGALRRGEETLRELELVVHGDLDAALRQLSRLRQVVRVDFARRTAQLGDGIPLLLHPAEPSVGNALLLTTGSAAHVAAVCDRAERSSFAIAGAPRTGLPGLPARTFASEADLYAAVGVCFVPPELRQGADELEQAARGDFSDLVDAGDIVGMVHCHTTYSDGKNSVIEMASAAHALGMSYITITDHSPSAHYASGLTLDRLKQQWDEIAEAQERVPIHILRGTESDILIDGSLDFPDQVLEQFDVIIASIHARHRLGHQQMTDRLVRAMSLPVFKIWGHGLGRILNHRPAIDCDVPIVIEALANSQGAIELNADPHRLDLPASWIPAARARRIPFVISVDAHSINGFAVLRHGITQARRGGVRKHEVLNTLPPEEFLERVRPVPNSHTGTPRD
jgi:DNA polymerase (family 10)